MITKVCIEPDCPRAGEPQPLENFPPSGRNVRPRCRPCNATFRQQYKVGMRVRARQKNEVPSGPFIEWLETYVGRRGLGIACETLDVSERFVYRWLKEPGPYVQEHVVDRLFCAADEPYLLMELYPELYLETAA